MRYVVTSSQLLPSAWVDPKTDVPKESDIHLADKSLDMFVSLCANWITKPSKKQSPSKREPEPTKIKQHSDQLSKSKIVGNLQI